MKTKIFNGFTSLIITLLSLAIISGCSERDSSRNVGKDIFIEYIKPVPEELLTVVDGYTSGMIDAKEPIKVKFAESAQMKLKYGEEIPSGTFKFEPSLKGRADWIDDNTVGFFIEKADKKSYHCIFNASLFADIPQEKKLEFDFGIREQRLNIVKMWPLCEGGDVMSYVVGVNFANSISIGDVEKLASNSVKGRDIKAKVRMINDKSYEIEYYDITRTSSSRTENIKLDGSDVNAKESKKIEMEIFRKDVFAVADAKFDASSSLINIFFTQPLDESQNLDGFIVFNKQIGYKTSISNNKIEVFIDGNSIPSHQKDNIKIAVRQGIKSEKGIRTSAEAKYTFDISMKKPEVKWTSNGNIIPDEDATIYFDAVCLNSVTVRIVRIYDDNILSLLQDNSLSATYGINKVGRLEKKFRLELDNAIPTQWGTFPIRLSDYVKTKRGDMFQVIIDFGPQDYIFASDMMKSYVKDNIAQEKKYWDGESYDFKVYNYEGGWDDPSTPYYYNYVNKERNVLVSDLSITAKSGSDNIIDIFVNNISDAKPASADVSVFNYQKQYIGGGKTDVDGYIRIQTPEKAAFVTAKNSEKGKSYLKVTNGESLSYSKFDIDGAKVAKGVLGFAYSNRGVWRPGDEIQLNLMLSDASDVVPDGYPVVLEIFDAQGSLYAKQSKSENTNGIYFFTIETSPNDETGTWTAKFKIGNTVIIKNLKVETVKPNKLDISLSTPEIIKIGTSDRASIKARWLNGMKATKLKAKVDVRVRKSETRFDNFKDYIFVNESETFYDNGYEIFSGALNDNGETTFNFAPLGNIRSNTMLKGIFTTKVFDQSGDFSVVSTAKTISPCSRYIGMKMPETPAKYGDYYFTGRDWRFDIAVVNADGTPYMTAEEIRYKIYKMENYWWWSDEDAYRLQNYVNSSYTKPIYDGEIQCRDGKASLTMNIKDKDWGSYLIVLNDNENTFVKVVSFDWEDYFGHSKSDTDAPSIISLKASKEKYEVGDEVIITFPSNEKAEAIVTIEANDMIIKTMRVKSDSNDGVVRFEATADMVPNVYVSLSLIQPYRSGNGMPIRMYGVIPITIENKDFRLQPEIKAPTESNTQNKIDIVVKEKGGKPMTYTLAVVDDGILTLTNFKTPNPYEHFMSKQALNVRTWDNYGYVMSAFLGEFGSVYAVGGDEYLDLQDVLSKRFKAYAVTMGPFTLKANETKKHEFEVPQCSGRLRVMVVAKDGEKAFGSAETSVNVIDPVTLYPAMPRVIMPGDETTLKIQVLSPENKGRDLNVKAVLANMTAMQNLPKTVRIDDNGEGLICLNVKADKTSGIASAKFEVTTGNYTAKTETDIPIRVPSSVRHESIFKEIASKAGETVRFTSEGLSGTLEGKVVIGTALPINIFHRLDYLIDYPHGCLEQTTSRAFAQLYVNRLVSLDTTTRALVRRNITTAIDNLRAFQQPDKSLTTWVGGKYVNPWTEVYALHFLTEAKKSGYAVPDAFYKGLVSYHKNIASSWNHNPDYRDGDVIQAYRLFVLALADARDMGAMNRFKELDVVQSDETKSYIAAAYALSGNISTAQRLLPVSVNEDDFSELSAYICAMLLCDKDSPVIDKSIETVCDIINGDRWLGTLGTSRLMTAVGDYAETRGLNSGNISAVVNINSEKENISGNIPAVSINFTPRQGDNEIIVNNNGQEDIKMRVFTKSVVAEEAVKEEGNSLEMKVKMTTNANIGDDITATITITNPNAVTDLSDLALTFFAPAGMEILNTPENDDLTHTDVRDDRIYYYFNLDKKSSKTFIVKMNATFAGRYTMPAVRCEAMYDGSVYYVVPAKTITVK